MTDQASETEEGGAGVWDASEPGHAELVQLRIRMIALENLLLAVLAESDEGVRTKVRQRAAEIHPREGTSDHPLTEHAGAEMLRLLARAERRSDD